MFERRLAKLPHLLNIHEIVSEDNKCEEADAGKNSNETDRIPRVLIVERYHIVCFAVSILSYIFDIGSDIYMGINHYRAGREIASLFVGIFAIIPSIVLNVISFVWEYDDSKDREKSDKEPSSQSKLKELIRIPLPLILVFSFFQLGPTIWHFKAIYYGLEFRKCDDEKKKRILFCEMIKAERDATLLRLFEGFMESSPQLIIQSTVLYEFLWLRLKVVNFYHLPTWVYFQIFSLSLSLFSLCWSITSQHRTIRIVNPDKVNVHPHETFLQLCWRIFTILSRSITIGMAIIYFKFKILIFAVIHYLLSLVHIKALQSVEFGPDRKGLEIGVLLINAFIHFFAPFNTAEGRTRWRYTTAYFIEFVEGVIIYYFVLTDANFHFTWKVKFAAASALSFLIGISLMLIYYSCFHPNRRRHKRITATGDDIDTEL